MMAYIVSKADLKVKDALTVISYEINEETRILPHLPLPT